MDQLPFAEIVRRRMSESGVGLRELCRGAGLDPSFFSKVLAGKRNPPSEEEVLRRLAGVLGLDAPRLIVSAGRIPSEWRRLWSDDALFEAVHEALSPGAGAAAARGSGRSWETRPKSPPDVKEFGEELL